MGENIKDWEREGEEGEGNQRAVPNERNERAVPNERTLVGTRMKSLPCKGQVTVEGNE